MKAIKKDEKSPILRVLKCSKLRVLSQDLDIRKMAITPNGKYLVTCAEMAEKEASRVCVWAIEKILEGIKKPEEPFLQGKLKQDKDYKLANWLLCVDAITTEIKGKKIWIVCAGSINGDVFLWSGNIDERSDEWIISPYFSENFSNANDNLGAIFDIRIIEDPQDTTLSIFLISNNMGTIAKEKTTNNFIKELRLIPHQGDVGISFETERDDTRQEFEKEDQWILSFDLFIDKERQFLIAGSNDNNIYKWDLKERKKTKVGSHEDGVTCVKIFDKGNKLASGCLNNTIKIWNLSSNKFFELSGHTKEILSIDIQKDNRYLISASKDNSIKIWDINDRVLIRDIDVSHVQDVDSTGLDFLRQIAISSRDQYIFAIKKDKILIIRNFGRIWHFCQQLNHIEKHHKKLYRTLYGANLRQIAERQMENEESLRPIYHIIKSRLINRKQNIHNLWELGALYIPSFIKFEMNNELRRTYVESVRTNYISYWSSVKKMFYKIPEISWQFRLFLTTGIDKEIEEEKFIEVTRESKLDKDAIDIILEDRDQSQIRFLMVLDNVPTTFIPLLKAITLDVEDNRGDKDKLVFTDFKRSKDNFVKILDKPRKSTEKFVLNAQLEDLSLPDRFYYSSCIFKLDERYSTDFKKAEIYIRKKTLEFTESLNPLESNKAKPHHINLFEAFRNHFHSPNTPNISIQIGKGLTAKVGKAMDTYFAKLVMLDFFFTIISIYILYLEIFIGDKEYLLYPAPAGTILFAFVNIVSFLILLTLILSVGKRKGKKPIEPIPKGFKLVRGD